MGASEMAVLSLLKIQDCMAQIISSVVEKGQHGRSDKFRTVLDETLGVYAFHEHLQTTHRYSYIRTEGGKSRSQQAR